MESSPQDTSDAGAAPAAQEPAGSADHRRVLKNAMFLVVAQAIVTPLSIVINIVMARSLGAEDFGHLYLAMTFAGFGFLFVEWGQGAMLIGLVARGRERAGELLGSSLAWRLGASLPVTLALVIVAWAFDYGSSFTIALLLVAAGSIVSSLIGACQDVIRGFERTDFGALSYVGWQLLRLLVVVPTLLLGGGLKAVLAVQALSSVLGLVVVLLALAPLGVKGLVARRSTVRELVVGGAPFMVFGLTMAAQANVDAVFLSKLASADAVGWYAAATKLSGVLIYPASVLISAVYPTLCRLHAEDLAGYRRTAAATMRTTILLALPVALGTALYPDLGIRLFSREAYGPAEDDLRVLALYLLLVFVSMPMGSVLVAAGRQRPWALAQLGAVIVSLTLDPILVPVFHRSRGNGGLGVCVTTVLGEVLILAVGLTLVSRGVFDRPFLVKLARVVLAGVAMALVAWAATGLPSIVSAALAVVAYVAGAWLFGGLDRDQLAALRALVRRRRG